MVIFDSRISSIKRTGRFVFPKTHTLFGLLLRASWLVYILKVILFLIVVRSVVVNVPVVTPTLIGLPTVW